MNTEDKPSKEELKRRLRMKIQGQRLQRMGKSFQEAKFNQMKETVFSNMSEASNSGMSSGMPSGMNITPEQIANLDASNFGFNPVSAKDRKKQKKKDKKKLRELGKKIGNISEKDYNEAMARIKENDYKRPDQRFRDFNIAKLYRVQRAKAREEKLAANSVKEISEQEADKLLLGGGGELDGNESDSDSVSSNLSD